MRVLGARVRKPTGKLVKAAFLLALGSLVHMLTLQNAIRGRPVEGAHPPPVFLVVGQDSDGDYRLLLLDAFSQRDEYANCPTLRSADMHMYSFVLDEHDIEDIRETVSSQWRQGYAQRYGVSLKILEGEDHLDAQTIFLLTHADEWIQTYTYKARRNGVMPLRHGRFTRRESLVAPFNAFCVMVAAWALHRFWRRLLRRRREGAEALRDYS